MPACDRAVSSSSQDWLLSSFVGQSSPKTGIWFSPGHLPFSLPSSHAQQLDIWVLLIHDSARCLEAICTLKSLGAVTSYSALSKTNSFKKLLKPLRGVLGKHVMYLYWSHLYLVPLQDEGVPHLSSDSSWFPAFSLPSREVLLSHTTWVWPGRFQSLISRVLGNGYKYHLCLVLLQGLGVLGQIILLP